MKQFLQDVAMAVVDGIAAVVPSRLPELAVLRECKIISHRGEHDNKSVLENTLLAFTNASNAGVWGLECDIRWTIDQVPVIFHDATAERVFGQAVRIDALTFTQLREQLPLVPTLEEVVQAFGGDRHLMLELKEYDTALADERSEILQKILAGLIAEVDFHFLALEPDLFQQVAFVPDKACIVVAGFWAGDLSKVSLERGYAGVAGHFLLLNETIKQRHHKVGQQIGVGYPNSGNSLYRQLNRGVEWIFSNDAVKLQHIVEQSLSLNARD